MLTIHCVHLLIAVVFCALVSTKAFIPLSSNHHFGHSSSIRRSPPLTIPTDQRNDCGTSTTLHLFFRKREATLQEMYDELKKEKPISPDPMDGLHSDLVPMLYCSEMAYTFSYLREKAKTTEMKSENLIMLKNTDDTTSSRMDEFSKPIDNSISLQDFTEFITENLDSLEDDPEIDYNNAFIIKALLNLKYLKNEDTYLVRFNGQFSGDTFVYGILVNHVSKVQKRIDVIFRGTSELGDWKANLNACKSKFKRNRDNLEKLGFDVNKEIAVHAGFRSFLFDPAGPNPDQKYNEVKENLLALYRNGHDGRTCEGYELFISGHSLGGALSTLMSFYLATSNTMAPYLGEKPVVNVSFASPYVGGRVWAEAFRALEKAGRIQHIRVSNQNDPVPALIALPDYEHVGVNLHLNPDAKDGYELVYGGNRSLWQAWGLNSMKAHFLVQHYDRQENIKQNFMAKTIGGIYSDIFKE